MIDVNKRVALLLSKCRKDGLVNPVTGEGSPTHAILVEEILNAQNEAGQELDELVMYVRRLARLVRKHEPHNKLAADAIGLLVCTGHIKALRSDSLESKKGTT